MALIKDGQWQCWQRCREIETLTLLVLGIWNCAAALENILSVAQKVEHRITMYPGIPPLGICPNELKNTHKNVYVNVYSSIIPNSQKVK